MVNTEYSYNNQCLMKDGRPWFPVMGEIHYSRYRADLWEESLRKMKAGGVSIVSTYVIWIHHEEVKGSFDFTGCRNVKGFLGLCKRVGLKVFLRIGPWAHGEVRNGGFPDWLIEKGREGLLLRSDAEAYLAYVRHFWEMLYEQVQDFMYSTGGPVIGIQIENEYGHAGGLQGEAGEQHIRTLTALAKAIGFNTPYYTATGWGGACIGDLLPVMGGYCEAPWNQTCCELPANNNYVFSHIWNDTMIACDHQKGENITFDKAKYPYLMAELGGGLQVTKHRRPVANANDIGAMSLVKLGSGAAMLGYYMYHGGSNPFGKLSTLQESRATGYANDLPEINYDFNAPIRQFGTISDTYKEVKLLAYFLQEFGEDMAALPAEIIPDSLKPEDNHSLRLSYRHDGTHGYIFFNNYQRRRQLDEYKQVILRGICRNSNTPYSGIVFPPIDIADGEYGFFPYNMKLDRYTLISALATPLCCIRGNDEESFVFYGDREPEYNWRNALHPKVIHLSREEALDAWKVTTDRDYLIISKDFVYEMEGCIRIAGTGDTVFRSYPELNHIPDGFCRAGREGSFTKYRRIAADDRRNVCAAVHEITVQTAEQRDSMYLREYELDMQYCDVTPYDLDHDILLEMSFSGESMDVYCEGKKINDYFYTGQRVLLSLRYFDYPKKLRLIVHGLKEGEPIFLETLPEFKEGIACGLEKVEVNCKWL